MTKTTKINASGLLIKIGTGKELSIMGAVTYSPEHDTYYCNGASFPAEIVVRLFKEVSQYATI